MGIPKDRLLDVYFGLRGMFWGAVIGYSLQGHPKVFGIVAILVMALALYVRPKAPTFTPSYSKSATTCPTGPTGPTRSTDTTEDSENHV